MSVRPYMSHVSFEVIGRAQPAGSKRAFVNPVTNKAIVTDANAKSKPWKQEVAAAAAEAMRAHGLELFTGALWLDVTFYFTRPKSHFTAKGDLSAMAPEYHVVRPDATKLLRGVEDALTGVVYRDDSQIVAQKIAKYYAKTNRVFVWVRER